jgi:hypothetical protein
MVVFSAGPTAVPACFTDKAAQNVLAAGYTNP